MKRLRQTACLIVLNNLSYRPDFTLVSTVHKSQHLDSVLHSFFFYPLPKAKEQYITKDDNIVQNWGQIMAKQIYLNLTPALLTHSDSLTGVFTSLPVGSFT